MTQTLAITEADYPMLLWAVVIAVLALGPALKGWVDVVRWFKGDALDTSKLATKAELTALEIASREELKAIESRLRIQQRHDLDIVAKQIADLTATVQNFGTGLRDIHQELLSIHRALGRAEGELESVTKPNRPQSRRLPVDPR